MAACDEAEPRVQYLTPQVPVSLRSCRAAPSWSRLEARAQAQRRNATQAEVAEFIALFQDAYMDCKTKLAAMDALLRKVEARAKGK